MSREVNTVCTVKKGNRGKKVTFSWQFFAGICALDKVFFDGETNEDIKHCLWVQLQ